MQFTLFVPMLPDIPELIGVAAEDASWLLTVSMIAGAVSTPIVARAADSYGKRRMLIVTLAGVTVGSVVCALAEGFVPLLIGRGLQGFGASLIAVGISILRDKLPEDKVGTGVALMSATMGIGSGLALPFSGMLYHNFGWHSVFWLSSALGLLLLCLVILLIDESTVRTPGRFDLIGAVLFSAALVSLLLPITKGTDWGWTNPWVPGLAVCSLVLFAFWIPSQLKRSQPMVDLRLARERTVLTTNMASVFVGFAMFSNFLLTVQVLQMPTGTGAGMGLDAATAGLAMVPMGLCMVVMSPITGRMLNVWGGRICLILGAGTMSIGYVLRYFLDGSVLQIIVSSVVVGVGSAVAYSSMPMLVMGAVPNTETASANGLNALTRTIGSALASAVVTVILAATTVGVGGESLASPFGVGLVVMVSGAAAAVGMTIAVTLPPAAATNRQRAKAGSARETVLSGYVILGGEPAAHSAIVSVVTSDGEEIVDWNRTDGEGRYSLAVPGEGTYLFMASAQGWKPLSELIQYPGSGPGPNLELDSELQVRGAVTAGRLPSQGARVVLLKADGTTVRSGTTSADGRYEMTLPPVGVYLATAVSQAGELSEARKVDIPVEDVRLDFELVAERPEVFSAVGFEEKDRG